MDADRWVTCSCHGRHWGAYGAAGLLLLDGDGRGVIHPAAQGLRIDSRKRPARERRLLVSGTARYLR